MDHVSVQTPSESAEITALLAESDQHLRIPYYCEENVWRLAHRRVAKDATTQLVVAFISNATQSVAMLQQKAMGSPSKICCWDYHVILIQCCENEGTSLVFDIDSYLPYPCPLSTYLEQSFPASTTIHRQYVPFFRILRASDYLQNFSSDRRHMFDKETQTWKAPPPSYACINNHVPNNLDQFLDFSSSKTDEFGKIVSLETLSSQVQRLT